MSLWLRFLMYCIWTNEWMLLLNDENRTRTGTASCTTRVVMVTWSTWHVWWHTEPIWTRRTWQAILPFTSPSPSIRYASVRLHDRLFLELVFTSLLPIHIPLCTMHSTIHVINLREVYGLGQVVINLSVVSFIVRSESRCALDLAGGGGGGEKGRFENFFLQGKKK